MFFNLALLLLAILFALYYASYNHFGVTVLGVNFIGNSLTLESLVTGVVIGIRAAAVLMWGSCVNAVVSSDKIVYLLGKISPRISLFLSILLRMVPRIKAQARRVDIAQQAIGRGISQGSLLQRGRSVFRLFSILITWIMEYMMKYRILCDAADIHFGGAPRFQFIALTIVTEVLS